MPHPVRIPMLSTNTSVIWGDLPGIKDWWNSSPDAQMTQNKNRAKSSFFSTKTIGIKRQGSQQSQDQVFRGVGCFAQRIFDFFGIMFDCLFRQVLMKEGITDSDDLPAYFLAQSTGSCSVLIGKSKDGTEHDNDRKNGQWF